MEFERPFGRWRWPSGLSSRLLLLTAAFVVLADLFILAPALSSFQERWLLDRIRRAEIAAGAVDVAPDNFIPSRLAERLLTSAGVTAVAIKEEGRRRLVLAPATPLETTPDFTDLRRGRIGGWLVAPWQTLFGSDDRQIRAIASPCCRSAEFVEIVTPAAPLKAALWDYLLRIFALSLVISIIAGGAIYAALSAFIVRPMRRITAQIERFRADPEDAPPPETPTRHDEIGRVEQELARMQEEVRTALRSRARLAALGEAVAKINHDLRNMLTSAQLASERLAGSEDPTVAQALPRLERALDRALNLTREVLNYGKSAEAPPDRRKVALRAAVEAAAEDAGLAPGGVVLKTGVTKTLAVDADPQQLHRILVNLMRNARQAIESADRTEGLVRVSAERADGLVLVRVADDGPGVPDKVRAQLFTAFAGSGRGAGLGLAISRELAQAHGGDVELIETGPAGSVFELRLPAAGPAPAARKAKSAGARKKG